jgi:hypothetical protein
MEPRQYRQTERVLLPFLLVVGVEGVQEEEGVLFCLHEWGRLGLSM